MKKKIIYSIDGLYRDDFRVTGYEFGEGEKTLCIVGAMRGNEVQQLYCCSMLIKKFKQLEEEGRIKEGCSILIIPSANPYSMNIKKRFWPTDNTDINRMFPGYDIGETTQRIADGVFNEIKDYKYGIQFTSFYMPGEYVPHIRMMKLGYNEMELAKLFGLPYIVEREVRPYDTTTLNYNWQVWETQAFSFYTTKTDSIDKTSAGQAVLSILNFLSALKVVKYHGPKQLESRIITDTEMVSVQTAKSGFFDSKVNAGMKVKIGEELADIIHPYNGDVIETLYSPVNGTVFFMHSEPLTYANTAVFKIVED